MYKYVLFDMDGTVLDTIQDLTDAVNYTLRRFRYPEITTDDCKYALGNGARHLLEVSTPPGADIEALLEVYLPYYKDHCLIKTAPYPGIMELMEKLKSAGITMAVISNKPDAATRELADRFFSGLLDFAVGESETVKRKPNPDAVLAAIRNFNAAPEDCVYVGDTEVDIRTAENAGIHCITVGWGFRTRQDLFDAGATEFVSDAEDLYRAIMSR